MSEESDFVSRVKASRLPASWLVMGMVLMRKPVVRWAALVDQEAAASPAVSRLDVIHRYSQALDQKTAGMVGFSGIIVAAFALISPQVALQLAGEFRIPLIAASALTALFALFAAVYSLSALGTMPSKLASGTTLEALEIAHLQRLAYRTVSFNAGLRCAQVAGTGLAILFGLLFRLEL
jgi:hypothetical protein